MTPAPKLIRDNIPKIAENHGDRLVYHPAIDDAEFQRYLRAKLVEEAAEARDAQTSQELAAELADLLEVIDTAITTNELTMEQVRALQAQKRQTNGGFSQKLILIKLNP